jgi:putative ATP-binding cassette transporter
VKNLKITLPNNRIIIDHFSLDCYSGDRILILGQSGAGKTTLLKTFSGIWPFFEGKISKYDFLNSLFIAQRTYIPNSSLRHILCYPKIYNLPNDDIIVSILLACGLPNLVDKLDTLQDFNKILSVGELQKISFCRILINKPDIIYLDEATAALDEYNEKILYQKIIETLPNSVIISTGHRDSLRLLHNKVVNLTHSISNS